MRFTRDLEYALISLIAMGGEESVTSARDIAHAYTVPYERLCKILQRLSAAGILDSMKGAHGGYRLLMNPERLSLGEIIDAVQGKKKVAPCLEDEACVRAETCNIKGGIRNVQSMWENMMASVTLAELSDQRFGQSG